MKQRIRAFITLLCIFAVGWTVLAQTGGGYNLTWSTLEGGSVSSGGAYTLGGVISQPDSGSALTGGIYNLPIVRLWRQLPRCPTAHNPIIASG